jgi:hypothetical protein
MNQSRVNIFKAIRFLADVSNQINVDVPPLKQSYSGLLAHIPVRIGALRFRWSLYYRATSWVSLGAGRPAASPERRCE